MPFIDDAEKVPFDASITYGLGKKDRVIRCFKCLRQVYRDNPEGTIWFYVPDIYLFIFILPRIQVTFLLAMSQLLIFSRYFASSLLSLSS